MKCIIFASGKLCNLSFTVKRESSPKHHLKCVQVSIITFINPSISFLFQRNNSIFTSLNPVIIPVFEYFESVLKRCKFHIHFFHNVYLSKRNTINKQNCVSITVNGNIFGAILFEFRIYPLFRFTTDNCI